MGPPLLVNPFMVGTHLVSGKLPCASPTRLQVPWSWRSVDINVSNDDLLLKKHKYFQSTEVNLRLDEPVGLPDNILVVSVVEEVATPNRPGVLVQRVGLMHPGQ